MLLWQLTKPPKDTYIFYRNMIIDMNYENVSTWLLIRKRKKKPKQDS